MWVGWWWLTALAQFTDCGSLRILIVTAIFQCPSSASTAVALFWDSECPRLSCPSRHSEPLMARNSPPYHITPENVSHTSPSRRVVAVGWFATPSWWQWMNSWHGPSKHFPRLRGPLDGVLDGSVGITQCDSEHCQLTRQWSESTLFGAVWSSTTGCQHNTGCQWEDTQSRRSATYENDYDENQKMRMAARTVVTVVAPSRCTV